VTSRENMLPFVLVWMSLAVNGTGAVRDHVSVFDKISARLGAHPTRTRHPFWRTGAGGSGSPHDPAEKLPDRLL